MDTTEYIKNCIEQIKADYIDTEGHFEFGMFNSKGLVAMNIMIFPEEQTITTYAIMGYWVPEEKRETVLDLIQPDDGYDVTLYITSEGYLCGESTCKIQENMDMDFFNNTVLLPANCLVHYMPDIVRTILTPNPKE